MDYFLPPHPLVLPFYFFPPSNLKVSVSTLWFSLIPMCSLLQPQVHDWENALKR